MVLRLLNNLQLNMESKGVDFGPRLSNAGLYYAGKLQRLPAVRKYLQILCANSYATDWRTVAALRFVFRTARTKHALSIQASTIGNPNSCDCSQAGRRMEYGRTAKSGVSPLRPYVTRTPAPSLWPVSTQNTCWRSGRSNVLRLCGPSGSQQRQMQNTCHFRLSSGELST